MKSAVTSPKSRSRTAPNSVGDEPKDWVKIASILAEEFRRTAVERERRRPLAEIGRLKETGLVNLLIPKKFGGEGGTLGDAARAVLEISRADGSLGFLLSSHFTNSNIPRQIDLANEGEVFDRKSADHRWFWGSIMGSLEISAEPTPDGGFILNGTKQHTGPTFGDALRVVATRTDRKELVHVAIPTDRTGLKLTDTLSIILDRVEVRPDEVIRPSSNEQTAIFGSFGGALFVSAFYLGILEEAIIAVRDYLGKTPSSRPATGRSELSVADPFTQVAHGHAWIKLQALQALFQQQIREVEQAWEKRRTINRQELGDISRRGVALQIFASEVVLDFTSQLIDLTGGHALAGKYGFDRFWRQARYVHQSASQVAKGIGEWVLGGKPAPREPQVGASRTVSPSSTQTQPKTSEKSL